MHTFEVRLTAMGKKRGEKRITKTFEFSDSLSVGETVWFRCGKDILGAILVKKESMLDDNYSVLHCEMPDADFCRFLTKMDENWKVFD